MSWRANMWLAGSLGAICMGIALLMAARGLWMVIPFAGAEVILIVVCLHMTLRRLARREVITVDKQAIRLEWGYTRADVCVKLPRQWSRLRYSRPHSQFEVGDLSLAAHGKVYPLGRCLGRDEKKTLYTELKSVLQGFG